MTATWNATPQDVERVIAAVLPHASEDRYLPVINNVRVELDGDQFLAVATDRYSVGICRARLTDWMEDAEPVEKIVANLRLDDVKRLFAFLRPQRKDTATWHLTGETLTVRFGDATGLTLRTVDAEGFPNWRAIVGPLLEREPEPGTQMGFTPRIVDHFQKTAKVLGDLQMAWRFVGPLKPVIIQIGEDFLGFLMPCRIPDEALQLDLGAFGFEPKAVAA